VLIRVCLPLTLLCEKEKEKNKFILGIQELHLVKGKGKVLLKVTSGKTMG